MLKFLYMDNAFSRTRTLIGDGAMQKLKSARVAVFGLGGVGGYCVEALARSGVGALHLVDGDRVDITNINRQIIATRDSVGRYKAEVEAERVRSINPDCNVETSVLFYLPENSSSIDFSKYDYIVDAVDTVSAKIEIIVRAKACSVKVISAMGAGNKLDPSKFKVADIYSTDVCPLARVMRRELKRRGVESLKVVYSDEPPKTSGERTPASIAYAPPIAGLLMASEVIKDLIK